MCICSGFPTLGYCSVMIRFLFLPDLPTDIRMWSIAQVVSFFRHTPDCKDYAGIFQEQEVDGTALLLLTYESLVKCLGTKLGHALKIMLHVESLRSLQENQWANIKIAGPLHRPYTWGSVCLSYSLVVYILVPDHEVLELLCQPGTCSYMYLMLCNCGRQTQPHKSL